MRTTAAAAEGLRRRAAAGHRHRPVSLDDRFLYVACWGTGEMRQYDVSDPMEPEARRLGPYRRHRPPGTPHPNGKAFAGGPQMVEISRDGKRVYWTNSLYSTWDDQFYPAACRRRWSWPMSGRMAG